MRRQLEHMRGKLEVDEPAGPELHVERAPRRLVAGHVGAHLHCVGDDLRAIPRHPEDCARSSRPTCARLVAASRKPAGRGTAPYAPKSMLLCADIARTPRARRRAYPWRPRDEAACRRHRAARRRSARSKPRYPAREAIEIVVCAKRLFAVRLTAVRPRVKVDDVEVGRVGQRVAAEPTQSEHHQLAARNPPCASSNSARGGLGQRDQRTFGYAGIAFGHLERIARRSISWTPSANRRSLTRRRTRSSATS